MLFKTITPSDWTKAVSRGREESGKRKERISTMLMLRELRRRLLENNEKYVVASTSEKGFLPAFYIFTQGSRNGFIYDVTSGSAAEHRDMFPTSFWDAVSFPHDLFFLNHTADIVVMSGTCETETRDAVNALANKHGVSNAVRDSALARIQLIRV